ncbi:hypothetical protein SAMN05421874_104278 [Nonomuraea maritima]|uniref:Alpha-galactosidase n=1 Tax=Nonomuraea maritima TaxID=683260 RepID=A0A1G8Y744_9ACTN|nr:hypothetical protein [Nonomuraea maritima]SDJ98005.1 hypothetical protein SAMN05421874_104278 [Nonomuraea maritima]
MRITTTDAAYFLDSGSYHLTVSRTDPSAELEGWTTLSLIASVHPHGGRDETYETLPPVLALRGDTAVFDVQQRSTAWETKTVRLTCTPETIALEVRVEGAGVLGDVTLLGGRAVLRTGAAGTFRSGVHALGVFSPAPAHPVQVVRPAAAAVALTAVGDASPGRLHAVFSPPPLVLAFCKEQPDGATAVPGGPWLGASVRAGIPDLTFTEVTYEPLDGGALLRLDYEGHTEVRGAWTSPAVVLRAAGSPWEAISHHRADLVAHGLAPEGPVGERHAWWSEPIFCGWGAQCARADGVSPVELSRQDLYDGWLARLEEHGIVPGTIVIDDRWQLAYGDPWPDEAKWPDLRAWIAGRHARGQRVLLWWRAWSAEGLPAEECVTDAGGRAVAADPSNPAYRRRITAVMERLLGDLGADGFKIDFTQRSPSGSHLKSYGSTWGLALLHELLAALYGAAKRVRPDALMVTHTPHPAFADVSDMVRLNDVLELDARGEPVPVVDQLRYRHEVVRRALPHHLVDTDQWPMPGRAEWLAYAEAQPAYGVPALYYAEAVDNSGEEITAADLNSVASWWWPAR